MIGHVCRLRSIVHWFVALVEISRKVQDRFSTKFGTDVNHLRQMSVAINFS